MNQLLKDLPLGLRLKIKILLLIGLLVALLPFEAIAGDGSTVNRSETSDKSVKINIFADEFIARLWPELPESYKIMAFLSASLMVEEDHQDKMDRPPAPLVGLSLTGVSGIIRFIRRIRKNIVPLPTSLP